MNGSILINYMAIVCPLLKLNLEIWLGIIAIIVMNLSLVSIVAINENPNMLILLPPFSN